jgi:hypothetical protein
MNDWEPAFAEEELVATVLGVATGQIGKARLVAIFESACRPPEAP